MVDVKSFSSDEEMFAWLAEQKAKVKARGLAPEQEGVRYGGYAVRFYENLVAFVYADPSEGEDQEVLDEMAYKDREDNTLWCMCYSVITPSGEYGYVHRSVLWPIDEETFLAASNADWDVTKMDDVSRLAVEASYHEMRLVVRG